MNVETNKVKVEGKRLEMEIKENRKRDRRGKGGKKRFRKVFCGGLSCLKVLTWKYNLQEKLLRDGNVIQWKV